MRVRVNVPRVRRARVLEGDPGAPDLWACRGALAGCLAPEPTGPLTAGRKAQKAALLSAWQV